MTAIPTTDDKLSQVCDELERIELIINDQEKIPKSLLINDMKDACADTS
jgi:hypothetical protein